MGPQAEPLWAAALLPGAGVAGQSSFRHHVAICHWLQALHAGKPRAPILPISEEQVGLQRGMVLLGRGTFPIKPGRPQANQDKLGEAALW